MARCLPVRYGIDEYVDVKFLGEAAEDPESIEEALQSRLSKQWQEAADAEFQPLIDSGTWNYQRAGSQLDVSGYLQLSLEVMEQ